MIDFLEGVLLICGVLVLVVIVYALVGRDMKPRKRP
jgi:hypothetical protein